MEYIIAAVLVAAVSYYVFYPESRRNGPAEEVLAKQALKKKIESLEDDTGLGDQQREELERELAGSAAKEISHIYHGSPRQKS